MAASEQAVAGFDVYTNLLFRFEINKRKVTDVERLRGKPGQRRGLQVVIYK